MSQVNLWSEYPKTCPFTASKANTFHYPLKCSLPSRSSCVYDTLWQPCDTLFDRYIANFISAQDRGSLANETIVQTKIFFNMATDIKAQFYKVPGEHTVDGLVFPALFPADALREIKDTPLYDDDVFVATYPKCGMSQQ